MISAGPVSASEPPALFRARYLAPRHAGTWATLALLATCNLAPAPALGRAIGVASRALARARRDVVATNLRLCFPGESAGDREALLEAHFTALGMSAIETGTAWWGSDARIRSLVTVRGLEHLDAALDAGRGALLLAGHFTTYELGLAALGLDRRVHMSYRPHNDPLMEAATRRGRQRRLERLVAHKDVDAMLASLRANRALWYAPDQNYNRPRGVFVPFFAEPAATMTATSWLARESGAAVVPFYSRRLPDGGYEAVLSSALDDFPSGDDEVDARRVNAMIEAQVRLAPEQYLWVHRRFKTRPPGVAPVYPQRRKRHLPRRKKPS